ncbi:uncharacterized protein [Venturia canescens]|uniref:uncharacterized protein n=1 Tax=Venturia canescens TaxID=32260 RepID=UPI001C9CC5B5|nr:uncharacterized protein LOC122418153 [Venturia canescens]
MICVRYKREMVTSRLHQSSAMGLAIKVLTALVAFYASASAIPAQFPHGKIVVFKYYGDVKAGIIEPGAYASQFALQGSVHVKHDTSDPQLKNAFYVSLTDVRSGMFNGKAAHYQPTQVLKPIKETAKAIETPFLIVFDEAGKLEGVKLSENEPAWSKNMKMAMASMLQLDLPNLQLEKPLKPRSFIAKENTIHGDCWVTYDVHAKNQLQPNDSEFVITKFASPKNCTAYAVSSFNHVDTERCQINKEEPVNIASRKVFEIEKQGEDIVIKKLVAHGGSNYFPWNARSEAHYILNNATFAFDRMVPVSAINLPIVDFRNISITRDLTYRKPETNYAEGAAVDVTQGRRVIDQSTLVIKLMKMLGEAADYLQENHIEMKEPDWKHGQTLNRMLLTMSYMNLKSLEQIFYSLENHNTQHDISMKNIFLTMIPQVGTQASSIFALNAVRGRKISNGEAIAMLSKLPLNIRMPSEKLLEDMDGLMNLDDSTHIEVRKVAILCYSSMVYRTMKNLPNPHENDLLSKLLQIVFDKVKSDTSDEMRVVYLMAMKNMEYGKIHEILAPIVRGELSLSEDPMKFRLLAIWAIEKSVEADYPSAHNLLWPIMADLTLPVKLRIAAYEILMHQAPTMTDVLHMYWFMVYEKNEHLYNFHHTTIKGIANSVDPCKTQLRELVRKIMRFTRIHDWSRQYQLSYARSFDYKDEKYDHAQKLHTDVILNEVTGTPEVIKIQHIITEARRPVSHFDVRVHVQGCDELLSMMKYGSFYYGNGIMDSNVLDILRKVSEGVRPSKSPISIDLIVTYRGRVMVANHYNERSMKKLWEEVIQLMQRLNPATESVTAVNRQQVNYERLYEKQVTCEMGLPVVFENRVPVLTSLKINLESKLVDQSVRMAFSVDAKIWRHGDYSMSVYNPFANVWHSVRRTTEFDLSLPIHGTIIYSHEKNTIKLTLPRQPATSSSIAGILNHAKDCVTVNEDDENTLNEFCPTCHPTENVSPNSPVKKKFQSNFDSIDTGLHYSMAIFNCENGLSPVTLKEDWYRAFTSQRKNSWNDWLAHSLMASHQAMKNMIISPRMGTCGSLIKIEPSVVHSTSYVNISLRASYEDVDHKLSTYHELPSEKYSLSGKIDVVAAATNKVARSWDLNMNGDFNQGHSNNRIKLSLTRRTADEPNYKICIEGVKSYTEMPADPLQLGSTEENTVSKLSIIAGPTDTEECTRDDILIRMFIRGSLSQEQRDKYIHESSKSACSNDIKNPLYRSPKNLIPKTLNCINEAILYTTLRNYDFVVTQQKVPPLLTSTLQYLEDLVRTYLVPNLEYAEQKSSSRELTGKITYPLEKEEVNIELATPDHRSYDFVDVKLENERFNGFGPIFQSLWNHRLDNTRFSIASLLAYTEKKLKFCSVYPKTVMTGDEKNIPFEITDEWTLVSGNQVHQNFAIFAKKIGTNMGLQIFMRNHTVEMTPDTTDQVQVFIDSQVVENLENGVAVPSEDGNDWILKVTKDGEHIVTNLNEIPIVAIYGINHVALAIDVELQGQVSGLCGQLNGTPAKKITKSSKTDL